MNEADAKRRNVRTILEYLQWHDWILGKVSLVQEEQYEREDAEYSQAYHGCRTPGVSHAAILHAKQEHEDSGHNQE